MQSKLRSLLDRARRVRMTDADREAQRRSFAFGNVKIGNPRVTRELIDRAAVAMERIELAAEAIKR